MEELRTLADEIHACARERKAPAAYFTAYSEPVAEDDGRPIFDRRL